MIPSKRTVGYLARRTGVHPDYMLTRLLKQFVYIGIYIYSTSIVPIQYIQILSTSNT